jgi:hypothetical protein
MHLGLDNPIKTNFSEYLFEHPVFDMDYRCNDVRFRSSVLGCQIPTATSLNLEAEKQIRIFGMMKSRITNVFNV